MTSRDTIICENEFPYGKEDTRFIPERDNGEILNEITPVSDTAPAAIVDTSEFVGLPTPPPMPPVINAPVPDTSPTPAATSPAPGPTLDPEIVKEVRPIHNEIVVLPEPVPTPEPTTGVER